MGKSRARVPSYYRQSIQNAVNRQINLGRTKMAASLNREAIGQVVSYCFVAAAHDILDFDAGKAAVLTVKMNNATVHAGSGQTRGAESPHCVGRSHHAADG